ncbi:MAG: glycoside hydrolase family 2 protein [Hafnia paralvei]|jgi:beta-mannosidase|uniref:glycoside hydrolase family 2 protein n=1 Tax=Hafnia paralvei TaxID=546367 RepID=UPI001584F3EB|nr:sugar-binding domain-containing protein [Hafnia paralvei]MCE9908845.1 beta galactosidase jelly roll domain-containing protein [Hafnia paralvei]MCE9912679.1 beta galactosidase jelly roll domain-containing protein [Hafnia paralvei]NUN40846.1 glycoside hydrolase family 2 [Hafnia paralvei]
MKRGTLCVTLLLLGCTTHTAQFTSQDTRSLDGQWQYHDANPPFDDVTQVTVPSQQWKTITVPANWYSAGVAHQGALWYSTHFTSPELGVDQMATLIFNAVDYQADVWINKQFIGQHIGYFQRFQFDITDTLQQQNDLLVKVNSPFETPGSIWPLHKQAIKGVLSQHDTRPGGAWSAQAQDANSGGIWQPVTLHLSRGAVIDNITAIPDWRNGLDNPVLNVRLDYRVNRPREALLSLRLVPLNFTGKHYEYTQHINLLGSRQNSMPLSVSIPMPHARLWWPYAYGAQNLYRIEATFSDAEGIMDHKQSQTGLREIRWASENHAWMLNGHRLFIRGTNYIGSPWLGTMTRSLYRRDLQLMRDANINAVRVHAHVASQAFYDQADESGMLVWQDMPLQWGYDNSAAFAYEASRQAKDLLQQWGNHPSVIVWAGQNEPPFDSPWMKQRFSDWTPDLNRPLAESVATTLSEDPSRIIHRWSSVNEHYWQGWYFGVPTDFLKAAQSSIISEFGAQALPRIETLRTIIPADKMWPATSAPDDPGWDVWKYHDFQPEEAFGIAKLSRGRTPEEFISNTQNYQADVIQLAAESYRRQRYQPVAALFQFMFSETWPSINWAVVDYRRIPKKGYFALQKAYQPVLPSIEPITLTWYPGESGKIGLWAINDRWLNYRGARLSWVVLQGGHELARGSLGLDLPADSGHKVTELSIVPHTGAPLLLVTELKDNAGYTLGENSRYFSVTLK